MKRYRVIANDFDTRASILAEDIQEGWDDRVKKQWNENKRRIKEGLIAEYGVYQAFDKIDNFIELGPIPISLIAFHNRFLRQARAAFTIGAYYPALTSVCSLGERILNHMILKLRDSFRTHPEYKKIYRKDSFDNWDVAINALRSWEVLLPNAITAFETLRDIRHRTIHFRPEVDTEDRSLALEALKLMHEIVSVQFSGFGTQPWFIPGTKGACYVKKEAESWPFVKEIVLPNCKLVGHLHLLDRGPSGWVVNDAHDYADIEITDERFVELANNRDKFNEKNEPIE